LQVCHGCHGIKWYPMHLARTVATHAPLEVMFTTFTGFLVAIWFTISKYITAALRLWLCTLQIVLEAGDQASPSMSPDSCGVTGNWSGTSFVNLLNTRIPNSLKTLKHIKTYQSAVRTSPVLGTLWFFNYTRSSTSTEFWKRYRNCFAKGEIRKHFRCCEGPLVTRNMRQRFGSARFTIWNNSTILSST
jgi:hypothetical protein